MRLVFLHAFPLDERMWEHQHSIAPGKCIAPNLYRLGSSLEAWATSVLQMVGTEQPIVVIGSSMGGSCAIEMARQSPATIAALVLVGSKAGHQPEPGLRDAYVNALREVGVRGIWPEISSWFSPKTSQNVIDDAASIANSQATGDLINATQVFHGRADLEHVLVHWKKPLLAMCGNKDPVVTVEKTTRLSQLSGNGKNYVMNDCGHFMNLERPDAFNKVVVDFLERVNPDVIF